MIIVFITILSSKNSSPFCQFLDGCYCIYPGQAFKNGKQGRVNASFIYSWRLSQVEPNQETALSSHKKCLHIVKYGGVVVVIVVVVLNDVVIIVVVVIVVIVVVVVIVVFIVAVVVILIVDCRRRRRRRHGRCLLRRRRR